MLFINCEKKDAQTFSDTHPQNQIPNKTISKITFCNYSQKVKTNGRRLKYIYTVYIVFYLN